MRERNELLLRTTRKKPIDLNTGRREFLIHESWKKVRCDRTSVQSNIINIRDDDCAYPYSCRQRKTERNIIAHPARPFFRTKFLQKLKSCTSINWCEKIIYKQYPCPDVAMAYDWQPPPSREMTWVGGGHDDSERNII